MADVSPELEALTKFAVEVKYTDIPEPLVHETKRYILDSIGCALAGLSIDSGKMIVKLARRLGGPPESSIWGMGNKVSLPNAVLANGQLINSADYDAFTLAPHSPPWIVPPPLNTAEITGAAGKDVILATAMGFEIASRVFDACQEIRVESGKPMANPVRDRFGFANMNFGVAAGVGRLFNLDEEKMMHALGIAGHAVQVLDGHHHCLAKHVGYPKYGFPGWQDTGAIMAVRLAEMGYVGDLDVFNAEHGFWKFCGYQGWRPQKITDGLGKTWIFANRICYKAYITCAIFMSALDAFSDIIEKNNLTADDITSVKVTISKDPGFWTSGFLNKEIGNVVDAQFSIPYNIAVQAHRVPVGPEWQDIDTLRNPKILEFMNKKVNVVREWDTPESFRKKVTVVAKGKTFTEDRMNPKRGGMGPGDPQMTDEELEKKFRHNAQRILTEAKIDEAVKALWNLEKLKNVTDVMDNITL
ncbi:MAG: MmgE/PrpD family protein [Promethearchaeota archaeon]